MLTRLWFPPLRPECGIAGCRAILGGELCPRTKHLHRTLEGKLKPRQPSWSLDQSLVPGHTVQCALAIGDTIEARDAPCSVQGECEENASR